MLNLHWNKLVSKKTTMLSTKSDFELTKLHNLTFRLENLLTEIVTMFNILNKARSNHWTWFACFFVFFFGHRAQTVYTFEYFI